MACIYTIASPQLTNGTHPRISQNRIFPCSLATASIRESGEIATAEMRPNGVLGVGQFLYTVQDGRCTVYH